MDRVQLELEAREHVSDHEPEHVLERPRETVEVPEHVVEEPRAEKQRVRLAGGALGRHRDSVQHRVYPVGLLLGRGTARLYKNSIAGVKRKFDCRS